MKPPQNKSTSSKQFGQILRGGDRRSIGRANQVAVRVLKNPESFSELVACLWSDDRLIRMRAADAIEKISIKKPELLKPFKAALLALADETTEAELRWHLALMLPRLPLGIAERERAAARLQEFLKDPSSIVKTCAIQGWVELIQDDASKRDEMVQALEYFCRTGTAAMKARSRKLLKQVQKV